MKTKIIINFFLKNKEKLPNIKDLFIIIGLFMAGKGMYMIYKPMMWILIGCFAVFLGWPKKAVK